MERKLVYFDFKGLGEGIRYLLHYGGLEFEDVRISREEYPSIKESLNLPYGKMPVYTDGDVTLHQSQVIARYIARQLNLTPTDPLEEAKIDTILHTIADISPEVRNYLTETDPVRKEELLKKLLVETFDYKYSRFDKHLAENNGHFGSKLYWVDIVFVAYVDATLDFVPVSLDKYPNIKALISKVQNLKGIKEYVEKRKALAK